jgi:hypothetical protein
VQTLDWIVAAVCIALAWPNPGLGEPLVTWGTRKFSEFAQHKRLAVLVIGAITIVARVALLPWMLVPQPKVHDEFSYLLAADTFVHGRLANPPHPLWIFFDTYHVIQHPTYSSMYPPAQGMALAAGKLLGNPWIGVLLSSAAMCMAITWMLQGWVPAEGALLGGAMVLSRVGLFSYWMNSYWGGAVAATGAALIMGALPRIWDQQRPRDAIVLGVGAGILATSRPVEGFIFCVPVGSALLWGALKGGSSARRIYMKRILIPLAAVLGCAVAFIAYYNWRVAGNPLIFPHLIEQRQYIRTALFLWQHDRPPIAYSNPQFDDFYHNFLPSLYHASWPAAEGQLEWKSTWFWQFFIGPALSIPFLTLPWLLKDRRNRLLLAQVALCSLGLWIIVYFNPHYAAPLMVTIVVLMMQGMRLLNGWQFRGRPVGAGLTRLIVLFSLFIGPVYFAHMVMPQPHPHVTWLHQRAALIMVAGSVALLGLRLVSSLAARHRGSRSKLIAACELLVVVGIMLQAAVAQMELYPDNYAFVDDLSEPFRKPVEQQLAALPGKHLVLVRYSKDHNSGEEYVYNDADVDNAKTAWAREIPGVDLTPLLSHFRDRDVWVYEPDVDDESVARYSPPSAGH